ncbi:M14 family zinc carboxypeptidase [Pilimelia columellifera]|uniref:Peptidase M14 domain-containing protein n=1 Tax=Pilimelia columellifera subsp. columellifera TaxID=706583 RepID=A0ABN3MZB0_9ACTN
MSQQRKKWSLVVAVSAALTATLTAPAGAGLPLPGIDVAEQQPASAEPVTTYVYGVQAPTAADAEKLARQGFDLLEDRDGDTLFVAGDAAVGKKLAAAGFRAEVFDTMRPSWENPGGLIGNPDPKNAKVADTFYGGYHTSMGHMNHLQQVASAKPDLTRIHNLGKTYTGKYDVRAICITKLAQGDCEQRNDGAKPKFFLMTQTHAREIAAGEMSYKFIDHLTNGYGSDAEVTALLDSTEVWVVPIANPDGLDIVAQGARPSMQRKNRNPTGGNCTGDSVGVDLNRNNDSHWGGAGTSKNPCNDTYLGPSASSELENKALHNVWAKIFKKQRAGGNSPAPVTATGYMLSIHTVAGMNLVPWQYANTPAPNDKALKAIGAQMKSYNGYQTGQAPQILYAASGGHDDYIYDKLGVASSTIELGGAGQCGGTNFHPPYSCVETYWKANKSVLMYLGKIAKAPYAASFGPNVRSAEITGANLSVTVDARTYENAAKGRENVGGDATTVEYSFDPTFASASPLALKRSGVTATASVAVNAAGQPAGRRMVYVRAKDKAGNYGPTTATWITVG